MADIGQDHERRISTIEGERKSLATKADLAEFKAEIMQYVQNALRAQSEELQPTLDRIIVALEKQNDQIRELREKESRFRGAVDTLKYALPFLISIIAVLVAVLK